MAQYHIIHHWLWLGAVDSLDEARELMIAAPGFDSDGYKILCKPVIGGEYEIINLYEET